MENHLSAVAVVSGVTQLSPAVAVPGGPELIVLLFVLAIPLGLAYWVYADAKSRGNEYAANWAITVFLTSIFYLFPGIVVIGLYREVRE